MSYKKSEPINWQGLLWLTVVLSGVVLATRWSTVPWVRWFLLRTSNFFTLSALKEFILGYFILSVNKKKKKKHEYTCHWSDGTLTTFLFLQINILLYWHSFFMISIFSIKLEFHRNRNSVRETLYKLRIEKQCIWRDQGFWFRTIIFCICHYIGQHPLITNHEFDTCVNDVLSSCIYQMVNFIIDYINLLYSGKRMLAGTGLPMLHVIPLNGHHRSDQYRCHKIEVVGLGLADWLGDGATQTKYIQTSVISHVARISRSDVDSLISFIN